MFTVNPEPTELINNSNQVFSGKKTTKKKETVLRGFLVLLVIMTKQNEKPLNLTNTTNSKVLGWTKGES